MNLSAKRNQFIKGLLEKSESESKISVCIPSHKNPLSNKWKVVWKKIFIILVL